MEKFEYDRYLICSWVVNICVSGAEGPVWTFTTIGYVKWKFKTGSCVTSSPAIGEDETIYVGSGDNYLYAIVTDFGGLADSPWPMFHHDFHHTGRYGYEGWK
ncbi:MAG: PQQ-binding-like beta-propeller repeat protein [Thermotogae bacterium]|nr:PQQ-binding-like beta-propeller repeat protein [Thermotogota bacterium]